MHDDTGSKIDAVLFFNAACTQQHAGVADTLHIVLHDVAIRRGTDIVGIFGLAEKRGIPQNAGVPALGCKHFAANLKGGTIGNHLFRHGAAGGHLPLTRQIQHIGGQLQADFGQIRRAFALQHGHALSHFQRVADVMAQRGVHIGNQGCHFAAMCRADGNHQAGKLHGFVQVLHERTAAHCNIQQDRIRTSRQLFAHDRGSNQRNAAYRCRNIPQGVQLFIRHRNFGGADRSVTEYTMSEIIASIYAKMEATGLSEGILFIDEINCVSETLAPTMLQFLQCKTFGNQAVPAGWVIVAAGNPPEYNKSVRDFDIVTLDRVRRMDIEPDLPVWKDYARAAHIHSAILSYLELHPQNFYQINADVDGTQFVTARGWEDLSNLLDTYEALGLQADEELIREYIQHPKIAEDFSAYLDLYYKYRDDYGVEEILAGQTKPAVFARLLQAPFDERLSLVSLLLAGLDTRFTASLQADAVADACYAFLRETKKALATLPEDIPDGSAELFSQQIKDYEAETQQKRDAGLLGKAELTNRLQVQAALHQWEGELRRANAAGTQEAFDLLRGQFRALADQREAAQKTAAAALEAAFDFMEQAFAESQEMVVFVTELTVNPASHQFLTENGCERYFKYNKDLLLDHRKAALQQELAAEQRRHGGV